MPNTDILGTPIYTYVCGRFNTKRDRYTIKSMKGKHANNFLPDTNMVYAVFH